MLKIGTQEQFSRYYYKKTLENLDLKGPFSLNQRLFGDESLLTQAGRLGGILSLRYLVIFVVLFSVTSAQATIYFTAYDPVSKQTALVYSSSGGNFWQTLVKGKGMVGAQASGLCENATPEEFLEQGFSAAEVTQKLAEQCDQVGWTPYRLSVITTDGLMSSFIAETGCHDGNIFCGNKTTTHFSVTGGGLEDGVLDRAISTWESFPKVSFICRLYLTLESIYQVGGEKKEFRGASIAIDDPNMAELIYWKSMGEEKDLLPEIKKQMEDSGVHCL